MPSRLPEILDQVLKLGATERAELVELILSSFDSADRKRIDALWVKEAEDRIDAHDRGDLRTTPATVVFDEVERNSQ